MNKHLSRFKASNLGGTLESAQPIHKISSSCFYGFKKEDLLDVFVRENEEILSAVTAREMSIVINSRLALTSEHTNLWECHFSQQKFGYDELTFWAKRSKNVGSSFLTASDHRLLLSMRCLSRPFDPAFLLDDSSVIVDFVLIERSSFRFDEDDDQRMRVMRL